MGGRIEHNSWTPSGAGDPEWDLVEIDTDCDCPVGSSDDPNPPEPEHMKAYKAAMKAEEEANAMKADERWHQRHPGKVEF